MENKIKARSTMNEKKDPSTITFAGLDLFGGTKEVLLNLIQNLLEVHPQEKKGLCAIFTPNPEQLVLATEQRTFRSHLEEADILLPDGAGLVWAVNKKMHNPKFKVRRLTGREVFHDLLELAADKNYKVFLLGGKRGSAEKIISSYRLDWQYDDGPKENKVHILEKIQHYRPDLLFVAYGAPYQEQFIMENKRELESSGVHVAMVVGGAFEYESGDVPPVSHIIQHLQLEWLQRLVQEPWRLKRQLHGSRFFLDVLLGKYR